jgi:hypothetical protein
MERGRLNIMTSLIDVSNRLSFTLTLSLLVEIRQAWWLPLIILVSTLLPVRLRSCLRAS